MASTFKVSKLNKVLINSTSGTTGAISSTDISSDGTSLEVSVADSETDPDDATFFTVSRMEGELVLNDYDVLFADTMNNGNTVETEMTSRGKVYVQMQLEDGTMQDSSTSTFFEVRPAVEPTMDVSTDDDLVAGLLRFTHSDHGGVQRPN